MRSANARLPAWLKWVYLGYVVMLVPAYWIQYGPSNFLWFSNVALLLGLVGTWTQSRLLLSTQVVSVSLLELAWLFGFVIGLLSGGHSPFGLTDYMFDQTLPLWLRGLSLYHLVLPWLLLWMVWRLGYDRRAWPVWTLAGWGVLLLAYLTPDDRNVNFVYGYGADAEQLLPPLAWLALVMAVAAVAWALTHWVVLSVWRKFDWPIVP